MDLSLFIANICSPPVLFFFLGMLAVRVKADIEFPDPVPKMLALYLLFSIGFKGGVELAHGGMSQQIAATLVCGLLMACATPVYVFFALRRRLGPADASAVSASYGSISAVTFLTAIAFLTAEKVAFGGHMIAAMALMEAPAILVGLMLYRIYGKHTRDLSMREVLKDAFLNGSIFLLVGSLLIGTLAGERGRADLQIFYDGIFKGVLCFFLLELGMVTARELAHARKAGAFLLIFGLVFPLCNAALGIVIGKALGLGHGDALLFTILCASASYIAVPAAFRLAVPEANPAIYLGVALGVTFPFNIAVGIPLYYSIINSIS
jgi:hypothetical protein